MEIKTSTSVYIFKIKGDFVANCFADFDPDFVADLIADLVADFFLEKYADRLYRKLRSCGICISTTVCKNEFFFRKSKTQTSKIGNMRN